MARQSLAARVLTYVPEKADAAREIAHGGRIRCRTCPRLIAPSQQRNGTRTCQYCKGTWQRARTDEIRRCHTCGRPYRYTGHSKGGRATQCITCYGARYYWRSLARRKRLEAHAL